MNYLDIIIAILLLISTITGFKKGFIHQLASLAALFLGIFLAAKFSKLITPFLQQHFTSSLNVTKVLAFVIIFIVVIILVHILGKILEKTFDEIELGPLNKIVGAIFSLVKMLLIISSIMILLKLSIIKFSWPAPTDREKSYLYKPIESIVPAIFPYFEYSSEPSKK
jgi:membrane protein required for colicin V production